MTHDELTARARELALAHLAGLRERPVRARAAGADLRRELGLSLSDGGVDPATVLDDLAAAVAPGLVATGGPRWFGFVDGGCLPVALAADWLTSAWDQNGGLMASSPGAGVVEDVVAGWVRELLGLPGEAGVGFVSGGQMANFTGVAAARHALLARAGWDVARDGLWGAPPVHVLAGEEAHVTISSALRMLGMGGERVRRVPADDQGRMRPDELARALADCDGPALICVQAGNVNSGAFDPYEPIADAACEHGDAWIHVDGAFGLWAAASRTRRDLVAGMERADSWAVDGHKWLNVPYDSGIAIVRDAAAHRAAMTLQAPYLQRAVEEGRRDGTDWVPEASRRARGFVLYAALRALGRAGVADLVDTCCAHARRFAELLDAEPGIEILNDVVLNQVLVGFEAPTLEAAVARTDAIVAGVQREGTCWLGATRWRGRPAARISVVNWMTTADDIERSAAAVIGAARAQAG